MKHWKSVVVGVAAALSFAADLSELATRFSSGLALISQWDFLSSGWLRTLIVAVAAVVIYRDFRRSRPVIIATPTDSKEGAALRLRILRGTLIDGIKASTSHMLHLQTQLRNPQQAQHRQRFPSLPFQIRYYEVVAEFCRQLSYDARASPPPLDQVIRYFYRFYLEQQWWVERVHSETHLPKAVETYDPNADARKHLNHELNVAWGLPEHEAFQAECLQAIRAGGPEHSFPITPLP